MIKSNSLFRRIYPTINIFDFYKKKLRVSKTILKNLDNTTLEVFYSNWKRSKKWIYFGMSLTFLYIEILVNPVQRDSLIQTIYFQIKVKVEHWLSNQTAVIIFSFNFNCPIIEERLNLSQLVAIVLARPSYLPQIYTTKTRRRRKLPVY